MNILCIDTSTRDNWIGLYADGKITDCTGYQDRQSCLVNLMPSIKLVLENAQTTLAKLDAIATVTGPGAWSGLRIGAATVKQLCLVNKLPLFTITNNDLIIENLLRKNVQAKHIQAVMDAQNKKVYSALYAVENGVQSRISDYQWEEAAKISDNIPPEIDDLLITGDGAYHFENRLRPGWQINNSMPQQNSDYLAILALLAETAQPVYDREQVLLFKPLYIQPSSAEIEFNVSVT
jgi:tRNA threonylcarbamoyladenosine biosynthesis protein TsaB